MASPKRVLFATLGSLGDLHPCLALATELQRRGHAITIATTEFYRQRVVQQGFSFHPLRPDFDPTDPALIAMFADIRRGMEILYREMVLPRLHETYADLLATARQADFLLAGELVYAAPLVAEKLGLRWGSLILSPLSFFSSIDPSVTVNAPWLIHLRKLGAPVYRMALSVGRAATKHWSNPVRQLRREEGLRVACDPVFHDKFSPDLVLALFSKHFAARQTDWPHQTVQPGFVRFEKQAELQPELREFFDAGEPPIVFTQGSTAVHHPGAFYRVSLEATRRLGKRAVLVGARDFDERGARDVLAVPYADYAQIFPRALVNVHQGGSGTTGEALRAGRPMLIVPYGWDQPDNAERVQRLGAGKHLPRTKYSVENAVTALRLLKEQPLFACRARELGAQIEEEDAIKVACDAIEHEGRLSVQEQSSRP